MREEDIKYKFEKGIPIFPADGNAASVYTGSWRVYKPKIDYSKCVKCKLCWLFCPDAAIDWKGKPVVDYHICKGCLICYNECPSHAISKEKDYHEEE